MLGGEGGQRHTPTALTPGKIRYPVCRTLGGSQGLPGQMRKVSPPPGFSLRTVQPLASLYTDCTTLAPDYVIPLFKCNSGCMKAPQCYVIHTLPILLFEKNTGGCLNLYSVYVIVQVLLTLRKVATVPFVFTLL